MFASSLILLALAPMIDVEAFSPQIYHATPICSRVSLSRHDNAPLKSQLNARGEGFGDDGDDDDDDDDDRDFVYAGRRSGRGGREEGGSYGDQQASSGSSKQYQDNVEFFDLEDDDLFENDYKNNQGSAAYPETFNGIIPNPLLDAMDPDGVYERLGPELFKDWTFFRDMALFAAFLTFFTRDTHHYGTFDSVIEGLERLPADFIH